MQLRQTAEPQVAIVNIINGLMVLAPLQRLAPTKQYGRTHHSTAFHAWDQIASPVPPANPHFISLIIKKDFAVHAKQATDHSAPPATQLSAKHVSQATSSPQAGSLALIIPA